MSCSIVRFLFCFGGAVEVRIIIYLSMLEGWRMTSRLIVMTLDKATFGLTLLVLSSWRLNAVLLDVVVCAGAKFSSWVVWKILTWLILPVVIRLSQRLSHACLSISTFILWNCEWLIISVIVYSIVPYYLDNRSNSRANTCITTQLRVFSGRVAFIRLKPIQHSWYCVDS